MTLPSSVTFFHVFAIVVGAISFFISLKNHNDAEQWNKCAPTLRVNYCPAQSPEDTFKCQTARLQMDAFLSYFVQQIRRKDYRELSAFYLLMSIVVMSVVGYILYFFLPLSGQLCAAKTIHSVAIIMYALTIFWTVTSMISYSDLNGPYGGIVCTLGSKAPAQDFGIPLLKKCFADYHMCQDAILVMVGVGLEALAIVMHFLTLFSAVWECQTQIDPEDWGTIDDLPPEAIAQRPDAPSYEILTEDEKKTREKLEKLRGRMELKQRKDIEKRRKVEEKERRQEAERIAKQENRIRIEREKVARQEEAKQKKEEERALKEEERKKKEEEHKKRLEIRRQREEEEKREREEKLKEKKKQAS